MTIREVGTVACWLAIVASFVLSFSTWLALGGLAGFGALAVALPFCVDGYVTTALATWLTSNVSPQLAQFAKRNLYAVGFIGMAAQASYHGAEVHSLGNPDWKTVLAVIVGAGPMALATLAVHIKARTVRELDAASTPPPAPAVPVAQTTAPVVPSAPVGARAHLEMNLGQPNSFASEPVLSTPRVVAPPAAPANPAPEPKPAPQARPRHKVEESGSEPPTNAPALDEIRRWVEVDGLTHKQVAARLGVSPRTATRRIADAKAGPRLVAAS
jgi:hypothetical protein